MIDAAAAVDAVRHFVRHSDTPSNQALLHCIDHSLDVGGTNAAHTLAPQLLQWFLQELNASPAPSTPSVLLYVGVLNHHYCLRVVLDRLAEPMDQRPSGLIELQQAYLAAATRLYNHAAARRQLVQCAACLLIVTEDHLVDRLGEWIRGGFEAASTSLDEGASEECRLALFLFMAVADLLVDRRVPIGSIRRATQRRHVQEHLAVVLQSPLLREEDMPLLVRVTSSAVGFLLEAMYGEPQEVAATFWASLPSSAVWTYAVSCVSAVRAVACPAEVLDLVCDVLRCLTVMDAAAEALLHGALSAVLQPLPLLVEVDWEVMSRVIAAALEASTEAIITEQAPGSPLFALFSAAAERLVQVLHASAAPSTAVCHVCEGISALTQVLQLTPLPEMESTDDPEDFQEIADAMNAANDTKRAALEQLQPFLHACTIAAATRLAQGGFTTAEWRTVAAYVAQRTKRRETDDFQVVHEEAALALFTTYERLTKLLGPLTVDTLHSIAAEPGQTLVLVMDNAALCVEWLQSLEPLALLGQATLLSCTVARHMTQLRGNTAGAEGWTAEQALAVADALLRALAFYGAHHQTLLEEALTASVLEVANAAVQAVLAVQDAGMELAVLQQRCVPLVCVLWQGVTLTERSSSSSNSGRTASTCSTSTPHTSALQLARLLRRGLAVLPGDALEVLVRLDAFTQAVLFATAQASDARVDTLEAFAHTLNCLARIPADADTQEEAQTCVLEGLIHQVQCHTTEGAGDWPAEGVAAVLTAWQERYPNFLLCFLKLATALPPFAGQPALMLAGVTRFFSQPDNRDTSTTDLAELLSPVLVQRIAADATAAAPVQSLLRWLLQPHSAFTVADGCRRVRVLAAVGRALREGAHLSAPELADTFALCVARWQEFVAANALLDAAGDDGNSGGNDDAMAEEEDGATEDEHQTRRAVLEELAMWGRCVTELPALPPSAPSWLASLQCAQDDYERMEVLKNL